MAENSKSWFRMRWRTLFFLLVALAVGWSAYSYWREYSELAAKRARESMAPVAGSKCEVELSDKTTVSGTFVKLNDEWIVLSQSLGGDRTESWIPRQHVLRMRVAR